MARAAWFGWLLVACSGSKHDELGLLLAGGGHIDPDVMTKAYRCAAAHLAR